MSSTADDIRTQIDEALAQAGVTFTPHYAGERKKALGGSTTMDEWHCVFKREEGDGYVEFDFFTGLGLRKMPPWGPGVQGYDNGPTPSRGTLLHEQWVKQAKIQDPHAADLLHSITLDAQWASESFASWCEDMGCDTDSRKALETYEACQNNADKLRSFFSREEIERFTELLQDY